MQAARGASRLAYHFEGTEGAGFFEPEAPKQYRNPILLAQEWQRLVTELGASRADLARQLGVSRARITQVLDPA